MIYDHIETVFSGKRKSILSFCELLEDGRANVLVSHNRSSIGGLPKEGSELTIVEMLQKKDEESFIELKGAGELDCKLIHQV